MQEVGHRTSIKQASELKKEKEEEGASCIAILTEI